MGQNVSVTFFLLLYIWLVGPPSCFRLFSIRVIIWGRGCERVREQEGLPGVKKKKEETESKNANSPSVKHFENISVSVRRATGLLTVSGVHLRGGLITCPPKSVWGAHSEKLDAHLPRQVDVSASFRPTSNANLVRSKYRLPLTN